MPYWIFENGETRGPMPAIDVLWQAGPTAQISDGEQWFRLDDDPGAGDLAAAKPEPTKPQRIVIRTSSG
jgi:hypothetical protein